MEVSASGVGERHAEEGVVERWLLKVSLCFIYTKGSRKRWTILTLKICSLEDPTSAKLKKASQRSQGFHVVRNV